MLKLIRQCSIFNDVFGAFERPAERAYASEIRQQYARRTGRTYDTLCMKAMSQYVDACTSKVDQIEARVQDLCDAVPVRAAALQGAREHRVRAAGLPIHGCLPNLPCCLAPHKDARHIFHCMIMMFGL